MIERLLQAIGRLPSDKVLHFIGGMLIAQATFLFSPAWALVSPGLAGAIKEGYDHAHPNHQADWWDWAWTVIGGLVGWGLMAAMRVGK